MSPASIFVWRVRLWLLAAAMGLLAINEDKIPVPLSGEVHAPVAHQAGKQLAMPVAMIHTRSNASVVTTEPVSSVRKPAVSRIAARPAIRSACLDRSASKSRRSLQASAKAQQCKTWSATAGANVKRVHFNQKQKFSAASAGKRQAAVTPARRLASSSAPPKVAKRSDARPAVAGTKSGNAGSEAG